MKILNIIPSFGGGGAERQLCFLAPYMVQMGHEVHVAYLHKGVNFPRIENSGVILHHLMSRGNYDPVILWQIIKLIKRVRPNILHSWILQMDIIGSIASGITGVPWVFREYSTPVAPFSFKIKLRFLMTRRALAVVSNSLSGDSFWRRKSYPPHKYIVPNALPLDEIDLVKPANLHLYGFEGKKLVLFAGRFGEEKNIENLLAALIEVVKDETVVALLCGEGPLLSEAKANIKVRGLTSRVKFPGYVTDVWGLMKAADAFVSISHIEGRPNTVVEAMGAGTPLVVSDIPMHREFLDQRSALIVDRHNPFKVAEAIRSCLFDKETTQGRTQVAKSIVKQWSVANVTQSYLDIYKIITR